jgi:aminoglycoside 3-N-acetyltransferase
MIYNRARLAHDLAELGLSAGRDVLVHSSLRRLGTVEGGAATVVAAIGDVIGTRATIVVPTQTADNSTTSRAYREAVKKLDLAQRAEYQGKIPAFDPATSRSHGMGILAEFVRTRPGAVRSGHPQTSFAALGRSAADLMAVHDLDSHLGQRSPLAALYAADAQVLLLGVGYDACIAFHLAEYRLTSPPARRAYTCFVMDEGRRKRVDFLAADIYDYDFPELGADLDRAGLARDGMVGSARAVLLNMRPTVDYAIGWMDMHRGPSRA